MVDSGDHWDSGAVGSHVSALATPGLVARVRAGDKHALSVLFQRHVDPLRRWARGRLPHWLRGVADTTDLVQDAFARTMQRLGTFDVRGEGALRAYLRTVVDNRIRDEHRRFARRGLPETLPDTEVDPAPSPFEHAIARETETRYLDALRRLRPADRRLVVAHVELGYTHKQLALLTRRHSADSARVALHRALVRLAEEMSRAHAP